MRLLGAACILSFLFLTASGCSTGSTVERWELFKPQPASLNAQAQDEAVELIFFRELPAGRQVERPINIYIDGHYHASLVGNTYTRARVCPGEHRLAVAFNDVERRYITKDEGIPFKIEPGAPRYFRVDVNETGNVSLKAINEADASAIDSLAILQSHAISRVPPTQCRALP